MCQKVTSHVGAWQVPDEATGMSLFINGHLLAVSSYGRRVTRALWGLSQEGTNLFHDDLGIGAQAASPRVVCLGAMKSPEPRKNQ